MHIALLIFGIIMFYVFATLANKSERTVGPARGGMWSGTLGDLMSGQAFQPKKEARPLMIVGALVSLLIAIGCIIGSCKTWPK